VLPIVNTKGNFTRVDFPTNSRFDKVLYFSYETLVGFQLENGHVYAHSNEWGPTTAKHINLFFNSKNYMHHSLDKEDFQKAYKTLFLGE
jgi:hypothetical protein